MNRTKELRRTKEQARKRIPLSELPVEVVTTMKKYQVKKHLTPIKDGD